MPKQDKEPTFAPLATNWKGPYVTRDQIGEFSCGMLHPRTMANIDCKKEGPKHYRLGRKVVYDVNELVKWLSERAIEIE